jgi:hypothetical protein
MGASWKTPQNQALQRHIGRVELPVMKGNLPSVEVGRLDNAPKWDVIQTCLISMHTKLCASSILRLSSLGPLLFALAAAAPSAPAQGLWGNALCFDGVSNYVQTALIPQPDSSLTVEAWAHLSVPNTGHDIILAQDGGGLLFGIYYSQPGFGVDGRTYYAAPCSDTDWHHWAGTYDATNAVLCIYRDGVLLIAAALTPPVRQNPRPLRIGKSALEPNISFHGEIDDVRVWSVARSQAELVAGMSHPLSGTEPNLLGYWPFNEGGGTNTLDASGHGYGGTLVNGPQWLPSKVPWWGNALSLNGTNQYVAMPAANWFSGDLTIEAWVYERSYGNWARVLDFGNGASRDNVVLALSDGVTGKPSFGVVVTNSGSSITAETSLPTNQWVHLAATLQGTNATIYVDGIPVKSGALPAPEGVTRTNNYVGRDNWPGLPYADAVFDELRIWNTARTAGQIREGMCHPLDGTEANLVGYWRFDAAAGTNAFDITPNHRDGVVFNGPVWSISTIPPFINVTPWAAPGLPGASFASVALGDYDNDGRLDFLLTGLSNSVSSSQFCQLWRNTGNGFSDTTATVAPGLPGFAVGSVAWGDYANSGRLGLLLTGSSLAQVWAGTGNGFADMTAMVAPGLPGVQGSSVAWGDYDNDGRLDFLLVGWSSAVHVAQLWRNTASGFTDVTATVAPGLPGVSEGSVAWGDFDNDGRLDFLLTGYSPTGLVGQVWGNTASGFTNVTATVAPGIPGVESSSVAWGDFNNDGRLDFVLTGLSNTGGVAQVWRNTSNGFTNVTASVAPGLPAVYSGSVAWGDYDNDGRLDLLLTGNINQNARACQLWRNTGIGFVNVPLPELPEASGGSAAWGDFDNDGRLDFLLTGASGATNISQIWRNLGWVADTPPAPPANLAGAVANGGLTFGWNPASDAETPSLGLTYNLRVGTTPGGSDIVSPTAATDGTRRLPALGNAQQTLRVPLTAARMGRVYWSVQAVDTAFAGGPFSAESSFNLWPTLGPDSGPVPGDMNGDGSVSSGEFANVLAHLNGNGSVTPAQLGMVLSNYYPHAPLWLTNTWGLGGNNLSFALPDGAAPAFTVLASTNLTNWDCLGPAFPRYGFTDTNAPAAPKRFYRLSWP